MSNINLEELLEVLADKENVTINIILEQSNIEKEFVDHLKASSLKMYTAIIEPEKSDHLAIKKEKCYQARFGWCFDDEEKIREQVIKFINREGITDRQFIKLRMTGNLNIGENGVSYKPDRMMPYMGWSLIAILTLQILSGLLSAQLSHPELAIRFFPTMMVISIWFLASSSLHYLFISSSVFMKKKGVFYN